MNKKRCVTGTSWQKIIFILFVLPILNPGDNTLYGRFVPGNEVIKVPSASSEIDLSNIPYKIVYETFRETEGRENWELFMMNADGSNRTNLTKCIPMYHRTAVKYVSSLTREQTGEIKYEVFII